MQPISRGRYLAYGLALMALKLALDLMLAQSFDEEFSLRLYWSPFNQAKSAGYLLAVALLSFPFAGLGVYLTLRRLYAVNLPRWLVFLFFVPAINLIFFAYLLLPPYRPEVPSASPLDGMMPASFIAAGVGCLAIGLSITTWHSYGWSVFLGAPFSVGVMTTLLVSRHQPRSFAHCASATLMARLLVGCLLISIAVEGIVCVVMSIPIAVPFALLGVFFARTIINPTPIPRSHITLFAFAILTVYPIAAGLETAAPAPVETRSVVTSIVVEAPPSEVWKNIIRFPDLAPPGEFLFRAGIAYPIRARIEGHGPGAIRYCEFSTGSFVEPITTWLEPSLLAFDVTSSPPPMRELSPYNIHPPHLDGFMVSKRGQFRLIPLEGGNRTLVEGTTWYSQHLYPSGYWALWTDWIIHQIHSRVLRHIQVLSEKPAPALKLN